LILLIVILAVVGIMFIMNVCALAYFCQAQNQVAAGKPDVGKDSAGSKKKYFEPILKHL